MVRNACSLLRFIFNNGEEMLLMTTQTIDQYEDGVATYSSPVPIEEGSDQSGVDFQNLIILSPRDFYDLCRKVSADPDTESSVRPLLSMIRKEGAKQTDTISSEDEDQLPESPVFNVTVSQQIATELREKEVRAFVPITAADLVWLEAQSMDDADDE